MAHLLEMIEGKAQMFSVKQVPWHGLGVILDNPPTAEEAIAAAGLNWTVSKRETYHRPRLNMGSEFVRVPDQFTIVRDTDEKILGVSGKNWQPLQNVDAFKFFDPYINAGEASYETAGSLEDGKRIWILAKINRDPIEVVKGDIVEKHILISNYHSVGKSVVGGLTPIRVVCNNTLTGAINNARSNLFRATHSKGMQKKLEDIQAEIALADAAFKQAAEHYRAFAKVQLTQSSIDYYLANVFEWNINDKLCSARELSFKAKQTETIMRLFEIGKGADIKGVRGTVWGLYNSVTEFIQHEKGSKNTLEDKRLNDAWFGAGMQMNERAFKSALALVG